MTAVEPLARYYFAPTVREGLAAYITEDTAATEPESGKWPERALIDARLTPWVDGTAQTNVVHKKVGLFGPGDVLGFDPLVVTRTDPRANVWDYEPNFMPMVELSEPDLPWRFTPDVALADDSGRLTPWIALVVLKKTEYAGLDERLPDDKAKNSSPVRWITKVSTSALPQFDSLWQWAHVHLTESGDLGNTGSMAERVALRAAVIERLSAEPGAFDSHIVARLICPRRLEASTAYTAFIVPTFKMGQVAAGLVPPADDIGGTTAGWTSSDETVDLPYYYRFEFGTSVKGDFEYLVRLLEPRPLEGLGKRRMNCASLEYGLGNCPGRLIKNPDPLGIPEMIEDPHVLDLEGALMSPGESPDRWSNDTPAIAAFRLKLAEVLNRAVLRAQAGAEGSDADDPRVVPPIFGRRHAQRFTVGSSAHEPWQNDVNLDPRQRAAAGFGAAVIEKDQEALIASVWDQLGHIEDANQAITHGQLGLEASKGVHQRLLTLPLADFLWTSAPVFQRIPFPNSGTVANHFDQSPIPPAALDPAFRRILRRGGGIRKRQQRAQESPPAGRDLLSRLNQREIAAAGAHPAIPGIPSMCDITDRAVEILERETAPRRASGKTYRISGRVVDRYSHNGIRGVRIEAWDKDPFVTDLIGSAVTNQRGWFRFELDRSFYGDGPLDARPDVFFKVLRRDESLTVMAPRVLRDVQPGDTTVVVEVDQGPGSDARLNFRLKGRVLDRATQKGVAWLRVEAWDKDMVAHDLVGGAVTNAQGTFTMTFNRAYSKDWFVDKDPDLYFKVFRGPELLLDGRNRVRKNVKPGETSVIVEIDAPAQLPAEPGSRATDFCEPAITCDAIRQAMTADPALAPLAQVADAICSGLAGWLDQTRPVDTRPPADLVAMRETVEAAIAPTVTIPARVMKRVKLRPGVHQRSPLARLESEVDFPQPMYEPLAAISQDLVLPGVEKVPQNTISILKTNRRFIEAYMLGLNDSLASEFVWRGAPVYVWTTTMRQFWDTRGLVQPDAATDTKDITRIATWPRNSMLGVHDPRTPSGSVPPDEPTDRAVLLVRGDVLKRYPNTLVYAINASPVNGQPELAEFQDGAESERILPIFSGSLPPDLTFLGFDLTPEELCEKYIVLEERLSEPRFGFDIQEDETADPEPLQGAAWWYDMTWSHLEKEPGQYINQQTFGDASTLSPKWASSSAAMANIALQRPVRMCVHGRSMLAKAICEPQLASAPEGSSL
jgi:hypothetical protein